MLMPLPAVSSPPSSGTRSTSPSSSSASTSSRKVHPPSPISTRSSSRIPVLGNKSSAAKDSRTPRLTHPSRHPRPRLRRWPHLPDLRHPPGHRQGPDRLLPEVRRRALQEPPQAGPRPVRPHPPRRRQPPVRAQEVRRSRRPRPVPEVVPLNVSPALCGDMFLRMAFGGHLVGSHVFQTPSGPRLRGWEWGRMTMMWEAGGRWL